MRCVSLTIWLFLAVIRALDCPANSTIRRCTEYGRLPAEAIFDGWGGSRRGRDPELATQPVAAEAGATRQGNMEPGTPPMAYHVVCEDPDTSPATTPGAKSARPHANSTIILTLRPLLVSTIPLLYKDTRRREGNNA